MSDPLSLFLEGGPAAAAIATAVAAISGALMARRSFRKEAATLAARAHHEVGLRALQSVQGAADGEQVNLEGLLNGDAIHTMGLAIESAFGRSTAKVHAQALELDVQGTMVQLRGPFELASGTALEIRARGGGEDAWWGLSLGDRVWARGRLRVVAPETQGGYRSGEGAYTLEGSDKAPLVLHATGAPTRMRPPLSRLAIGAMIYAVAFLFVAYLAAAAGRYFEEPHARRDATLPGARLTATVLRTALPLERDPALRDLVAHLDLSPAPEEKAWEDPWNAERLRQAERLYAHLGQCSEAVRLWKSYGFYREAHRLAKACGEELSCETSLTELLREGRTDEARAVRAICVPRSHSTPVAELGEGNFAGAGAVLELHPQAERAFPRLAFVSHLANGNWDRAAAATSDPCLKLALEARSKPERAGELAMRARASGDADCLLLAADLHPGDARRTLLASARAQLRPGDPRLLWAQALAREDGDALPLAPETFALRCEPALAIRRPLGCWFGAPLPFQNVLIQGSTPAQGAAGRAQLAMLLSTFGDHDGALQRILGALDTAGLRPEPTVPRKDPYGPAERRLLQTWATVLARGGHDAETALARMGRTEWAGVDDAARALQPNGPAPPFASLVLGVPFADATSVRNALAKQGILGDGYLLYAMRWKGAEVAPLAAWVQAELPPPPWSAPFETFVDDLAQRNDAIFATSGIESRASLRLRDLFLRRDIAVLLLVWTRSPQP